MIRSTYSKHLKFEPYDYQKTGIDFGLSHNYLILGDEMGLGKTIQAIGIALMSMRERILIVCPAFLKYNWEDELKKFSKRELNVSIHSFDKNADVNIISYAKVKDSEPLFKWADCVIADEVHYVKSRDATRTKAFHQFMYDHRPARFIGLSGTPITGKIPDWYSLLMLCSYNPFGNNGVGIDNISYWDFCARFCNVKIKKIRGRQIREFYGHKNLSGLRQLLKSKYIRRLCKDVLDLGEILEQQVPIAQDDLDSEYLEEMEDAIKEKVWVKVKKSSATSKAFPAIDFIHSCLDNGPVVVFSDHRDPVDIIADGLRAKKHRVAVINGDVPMGERHKINKWYQAGRLDVIVGTIDSMAAGLNFTKGNQVVFNDLSAKAHQNAQAIKRVHRIGQEDIVKAYFLTSNKMDKELTYIIRQKMKTMREAM